MFTHRGVHSAVAVAAAMVLFSQAVWAAPAPSSGPDVGGTTVTVGGLTPPGATFTQVSAGDSHSLAIGSDGKTYAWGSNGSGELGDGTTIERHSPGEVSMPPGVTFTQVSADNDYSLAIGSDGKTYAWGYNGFGQLGDGTTTPRNTPVEVTTPAGVTFTQVSAGYFHSLAIGSDGNVYAWGADMYGQLGDGSTVEQDSPVEVSTPPGVTFTQVSAAVFHSLALASDGNVYAWGSNGSGRLGDGTTIERHSPVQVSTPAGVSFRQIVAGGFQSLAVGSDGNIWAWGINDFGQLGDGTTTDAHSPVKVPAPAGGSFTQVSTAASQSLAVSSDGKIYAWGDNTSGQLGDGTGDEQHSPVEVSSPSGVSFTQVSAGDAHSLAIGSNGKIYAWGGNDSGQVGDGTTTDRLSPVKVSPPGEFDAVVTDVTFDGVAGTGLVDNADGTWSVTTPAHTAGAVDVVVSWTLDGVAQTPVAYPAGFTYTSSSTGTIGGQVWVDTNHNGTMDGSEVGLSGVTVKLLKDAGSGYSQVASTTTAADGTYWFGGLAAGDYRVTITPPSGYLYSTPTNPTRSIDRTLTAGGTFDGADFGLYQPANLSSTKTVTTPPGSTRPGSTTLGSTTPGSGTSGSATPTMSTPTAAPSHSSILPVTGTAVKGLLTSALALIALGLGLLVGRRRRLG